MNKVKAFFKGVLICLGIALMLYAGFWEIQLTDSAMYW